MNPLRLVWTVAGLALVGLGIAGYFLPGLPGTIFLILALACFKKGSVRLEQWMLNHPWFGSILRDWDENGWITARVKWIASLAIVLFGTGSMFTVTSWWGRALLATICIAGLAYILSRPTKPVGASGATPMPRVPGQ